MSQERPEGLPEPSLLIKAAKKQNVPWIQTLISTFYHYNIEVENSVLKESLFAMARKEAWHTGKVSSIIKILAKAGVDLSVQDEEGRNLFHYFASHKFPAHKKCGELAEKFVAHGIDINTKDNRGFTPLHTAVESGNVQTAWLMVRLGADRTILDNRGLSAMQLAQEKEKDYPDQEELYQQLQKCIDIQSQLEDIKKRLEFTRTVFVTGEDAVAYNKAVLPLEREHSFLKGLEKTEEDSRTASGSGRA